MKKKYVILGGMGIIVTLLFTMKCSPLIGECGDGDLEQISRRVALKPEEDSVVITTNPSITWWCNWVSLYTEGNDTVPLASKYLTRDSKFGDTFSVVFEDISVIRRNQGTVFIRMGKNPSPRSRRVFISTQYGDCFSGFHITQAARN